MSKEKVMHCRGLLSLAVLFWAAQVHAEVYQAPDPEPTPEETLILEYMNRFRADPSGEADKILEFVKGGKAGWMGNGVDLAMFEKEMKSLKPSPPLVFNLKLLDAARKHSFYMIKNGLTHVEQAGKDGFVAADFGSRIKAAGYEGGAGGENCFASGPGPFGSHVGFVIDSGQGGPGGMQPGRGHRMNMHNAGYREVGPGGVPHSKGYLSVTHNFGSRNVRFAGGVLYTDKNNNGFYDVGEGLGGVTLKASDGSAAQSWKSGAYALALQGNGAVKLTAQLGDRSFSKDFTAGGENVKFDWNVPAEASLELADKLLSQVEGIANKNSSTYTNAVLELYQGTKSLSVDEERRKRIEELTKELGPKLEASREAVRAALRNYSQDFNRVLLEHQKPFQGTGVEAWFKEAGTVGQAKGGFEGFKKQVEGNANLPEQQKRQYLNYLVELQKQLKETEFQAQVSALVDAAIPLADPKRAHLYKR